MLTRWQRSRIWRHNWNDAYAQEGAIRSWFQATPRMSLPMLNAVGVTA